MQPVETVADAKRHGIDPLVVGDPMGFWRQNMPERMLLRSVWSRSAAGILAIPITIWMTSPMFTSERTTPAS